MTVTWKGQKLTTWSEAYSAALKINTQAEGADYLKAFEDIGLSRQVVCANLGYWTGYSVPETGSAALSHFSHIFGGPVEHPVFGERIQSDPNTAYETGLALGEKAKKKS